MGCQTPGHSYSEENSLISAQEQTLGFGKHPLLFIEATFYRLLRGVELSEPSYQSLKSTLALPAVTDKLLKKLYNSQGVCEGRKLLLYAVLLAQATDQQKALALWNMYEDSDAMTVARLEEMLLDIASLSLVLPMDFAEPTKIVTEQRLREYFERSSSKLPKAVSNLKAMFVLTEEKVAKSTFLNTAGKKTAPVTSTRAIRGYIEETKAMPNKFAAAFKAESGFQTKLQ